MPLCQKSGAKRGYIEARRSVDDSRTRLWKLSIHVFLMISSRCLTLSDDFCRWSSRTRALIWTSCCWTPTMRTPVPLA